jgi:hypothetical protein
VLAHHGTATITDTDRPVGLAALRVIEGEVLLAAITALRMGGLLTDDEYQTKRERLAARR